MKRFATYAISLAGLVCCAAFAGPAPTPAPKPQPLIVRIFHIPHPDGGMHK